MLRRFMIIWVYLLPLPMCVALVWAWHQQTGHWPFVAHVLLLPILYGYIVPGIGTNILHKWHFSGPLLIGHYYLHHGFMYCANMASLLWLAFLGQTPGSFTLARAVSIVLCTAGLHGFVLWLHDIGIIKLKMVELYNRPAKEGRSAVEIATHYAPLCFTLIGATYAISAVLAYYVLVVRHQESLGVQAALLAGGMTLCITAPTLAYRWTE